MYLFNFIFITPAVTVRVFFYNSGRTAAYREGSVQEINGRAIAYGEEKIITKYKDYERVIEVMESRLRGGRFFK